jgi:hypothetical protein
MGIPKGAAKRFLEAALVYTGEDCLLWPYSTIDGYGQMKIAGRHIRVTRLVCAAEHGPAPPGTDAAHSCHTPGCVARRHLRWATRKENMADAIERGTTIKGTRNHNAKLTDDDVRDIRYLATWMTQTEVGRIYGIGQDQVSRIVNRVCWTHIT